MEKIDNRRRETPGAHPGLTLIVGPDGVVHGRVKTSSFEPAGAGARHRALIDLGTVNKDKP